MPQALWNSKWKKWSLLPPKNEGDMALIEVRRKWQFDSQSQRADIYNKKCPLYLRPSRTYPLYCVPYYFGCVCCLSCPSLPGKELKCPALFLPKVLMHRSNWYIEKAQVTEYGRCIIGIDTWLCTSKMFPEPSFWRANELGKQKACDLGPFLLFTPKA